MSLPADLTLKVWRTSSITICRLCRKISFTELEEPDGPAPAVRLRPWPLRRRHWNCGTSNVCWGSAYNVATSKPRFQPRDCRGRETRWPAGHCSPCPVKYLPDQKIAAKGRAQTVSPSRPYWLLILHRPCSIRLCI